MSDTWLRGDWMQTFTGARFYPLDPRPEEIDPADIAHALSLLCRYGGHVDRFYSVAEHCVLMSEAVAPENALAALLHDATEAYVCDVPRPLKRQLAGYREIEDKGVVGNRLPLRSRQHSAARRGQGGGQPDPAHRAGCPHAEHPLLLGGR